MSKYVLYIHRRDLRIDDNTALLAAQELGLPVLSCFILDPAQVTEQNEYRSDKQLCFMRHSLEDLQQQYKLVGGKLHLFSGSPEKVVAQLLESGEVAAVYANADYTPFAVQRDEKLQELCKKYEVPVTLCHDYLLSGDPADTTKTDGTPYTVFTPYWKKAQLVPVPNPLPVVKGTWVTAELAGMQYAETSLLENGVDMESLATAPGRSGGLAILANAASFTDYATSRDTLSKPTTRLSAHHKFGTVSIRETYHAFGKELGYEHAFIRQLYWRDFYTALVYFIPRVIGSSYEPKHEILFADVDQSLLTAWETGMTGVPVVDAGMRELLATGYMHNRARLIVGSFLTKDLHQPWWLGERHFARHLIDYDMSVNNGNWQWVGGTGVDPVPYFRVFNPWLQAKKFDPDASYIHQWVPELRSLSAKEIHNFDTKGVPEGVSYPTPMINHQEEMRKIKALYEA